MSKFDLSSNGIREDMIKLTNDLKALENDYQNVCEKIAETGENRQ
jgi:hypothetical protein